MAESQVKPQEPKRRVEMKDQQTETITFRRTISMWKCLTIACCFIAIVTGYSERNACPVGSSDFIPINILFAGLSGFLWILPRRYVMDLIFDLIMIAFNLLTLLIHLWYLVAYSPSVHYCSANMRITAAILNLILLVVWSHRLWDLINFINRKQSDQNVKQQRVLRRRSH